MTKDKEYVDALTSMKVELLDGMDKRLSAIHCQREDKFSSIADDIDELKHSANECVNVRSNAGWKVALVIVGFVVVLCSAAFTFSYTSTVASDSLDRVRILENKHETKVVPELTKFEVRQEQTNENVKEVKECLRDIGSDIKQIRRDILDLKNRQSR